MKNIITLTLIILLTLTSCMKDFYLEDLDAANRKIELQSNAINSLQLTINELIIQTNQDQLEITNIIADLSAANITIDGITIENAIQGATIDSLNTTVNTLLGNITEINTQLTGVNTELLTALNTADTQSSTIADLKDVVATLEAEIASFVPEIVTVIEYVERYHTNTVTVIETVELTVIEIVEVEVAAPFAYTHRNDLPYTLLINLGYFNTTNSTRAVRIWGLDADADIFILTYATSTKRYFRLATKNTADSYNFVTPASTNYDEVWADYVSRQ